MKIILSRKGFDSSAGGAPSPIVDGCPVSLPIPAGAFSSTSYADLGMGDLVEQATRGRDGCSRITRDALCHHDPMFTKAGEGLLGQCGAAQTHLANHNVGPGDCFVFFGLFKSEDGVRHHRIFGYLMVEQAILVATVKPPLRDELRLLGHPHILGAHGNNDVIYRGPGMTASYAHSDLRLTVPDGPPSLWQVPGWMRQCGLSYHDRTDRWLDKGRLQSVARGQEFVSHIGRRKEPRDWLEQIISLIEAPAL